jgi:hypothetical protein
MAYNDWVAAGSRCNPGGTGAGGVDPAQALGTQLGNIAGDLFIQGFRNLLHGNTPKPSMPLDPARQQQALAAQQLNNSGIYLLKQRNYAGAINEFQKALQQSPNDAVIRNNLAYAMQLQRDSVVAGQTSSTLGNLLGDNPAGNTNSYTYLGNSGNLINLVNLDPNVVDFGGMFRNSTPTAGRSYLPAANANALNAVLTGSDAEVVDLSGKTSTDPKSLKTQIDGLFGNRVLGTEPPDPMNRPAGQEIDKIFQSPQSGMTEIDRRMDKSMSVDELQKSRDQQFINKQFDDAMNADDLERSKEQKSLDKQFDEAMGADEAKTVVKQVPAKSGPVKPAPVSPHN